MYELETELDETIKSIEKYGGFYIGRYENGETKTVKPVVKRMSSNPYASWYDTYANLRTLGANENVKANIIWGCLWDETLQWLERVEQRLMKTYIIQLVGVIIKIVKILHTILT